MPRDDLEKMERRALTPREEFIAGQLAILLRGIRNKANLTQAQVAEKSGLSQGRISQIENGVVEPSLFAFVKIMTACGFRPYVQGVKVGSVEQQSSGVFLTPHEDTHLHNSKPQ